MATRVQQPPKPTTLARNVLLSLALIAGGCALAWFTIYEPYQDMANHEPHVSVWLKSMVFSPMLAIGGAFMLVATLVSPSLGGDTTKQVHKQGRIPAILVWTGFAIGVAVGCYIAFSWMPDQQAKFGYIDE